MRLADFGANTHLADLLAAAMRAFGWHFAGVATDMAEQTAAIAMSKPRGEIPRASDRHRTRGKTHK